jgi:hypothetical protein
MSFLDPIHQDHTPLFIGSQEILSSSVVVFANHTWCAARPPVGGGAHFLTGEKQEPGLPADVCKLVLLLPLCVSVRL